MKHVEFTSYDQLPMVLSAKEVSSALGISRSLTYALMSAQDFPSVAVGKRIIVPKTAFVRWLEENAGKKVKSQ